MEKIPYFKQTKNMLLLLICGILSHTKSYTIKNHVDSSNMYTQTLKDVRNPEISHHTEL